jgi:hypothetical protein
MHMANLDYVGDSVDDLIRAAAGIGADDDDEIGAKAARSKGGSRQGDLMAKTAARMVKRAPLGFGIYNLATDASITLTARVQRAFQADRLLVTASQLGVIITSIRVGDEEQLLGGSVPAELYGVNALADSRSDDFTPSAGGIDFAVTLTNKAATASVGAVGMKGFVKR